MAICYPDYGEDRSAFESPGEVKFYDACKAALDANYHVFHSVAWIAHTARGALGQAPEDSPQEPISGLGWALSD